MKLLSYIHNEYLTHFYFFVCFTILSLFSIDTLFIYYTENREVVKLPSFINIYVYTIVKDDTLFYILQRKNNYTKLNAIASMGQI